MSTNEQIIDSKDVEKNSAEDEELNALLDSKFSYF